MGNQSSQEKQSKTDATHIRLLLDYLTTAEKDHLLKQFGGNTSSFKSINVGAFTKRCKDDLPDYFDGPLAHSLGLYVGSHCSPTLPTMLTLRQCLDSVISITHGTTLSDGTTINTADAFVQLYILAAKEHNMSLEAFVTGMVGTGVQLWFEGSGTKFVDDTAQCSRLVNTILHFAKERQRTTDQMDWLLDDDQDVSKHNIGGDDMGWTQQVTAQPFGHLTDDTTKQTLVSWFETSSELGILFRLVAKTYFFGRSDLQGERLHQARISHGQCPSLGSAAGALSFSRLLSPYDYFYLCMQLPQNALSWSSHERIQRRQPADQDLQHRNIFSSRQNGNSWQVFANGIVRNQGATLLVIKTKDGSLFGGYADDPWRLETDWYGTSTNYLFQLDGSFSPHNMMGLWNATSNNRHYQYLCWGKKSLPNGLGMGGQLDYAGLWIDADFIHGHSKGPICSTYQSPRLSLQDQFEIDQVEVWLVRPVIRDEDEDDTNGGSVLDRAEDMEFLEMSGKKLYSRDLEKPPATEHQDDNHNQPSS